MQAIDIFFTLVAYLHTLEPYGKWIRIKIWDPYCTDLLNEKQHLCPFQNLTAEGYWLSTQNQSLIDEALLHLHWRQIKQLGPSLIQSHVLRSSSELFLHLQRCCLISHTSKWSLLHQSVIIPSEQSTAETQCMSELTAHVSVFESPDVKRDNDNSPSCFCQGCLG